MVVAKMETRREPLWGLVRTAREMFRCKATREECAKRLREFCGCREMSRRKGCKPRNKIRSKSWDEHGGRGEWKGRGQGREGEREMRCERIQASRASSIPTPQSKPPSPALASDQRNDGFNAEMPENVADKPIAFQSDSARRRILLSYWVVIFLGIPLWWVTTSIPRLPLPESRVKGLEPTQVRLLFEWPQRSS